MACTKFSFFSFLVAFILSLRVEAQSNLILQSCDDTIRDNIGNRRTVFEVLCDGTVTQNTSPNQFSILCELAGIPELSGVLGILDGAGPITILAPTDDAFGRLNITGDESFTTDDDIAFLEKILSLHIVPDTYLTGDFECNNLITTVNPSGLAVNDQRQATRCRGLANSFQQLGVGNVGMIEQPTVGSPSGIFAIDDFDGVDGVSFTTAPTPNEARTSTNLVTCNGVIQVVDNVLLPSPILTNYGSKGSYYSSKGAKGFYYSTKTIGEIKSGKGNKKEKYATFFNRYLDADEEEDPFLEIEDTRMADRDRQTVRENRRARLESFLVEPGGQIEPLN